MLYVTVALLFITYCATVEKNTVEKTRSPRTKSS